ncbi:Zinc finger SWIM domain-containing protein 8 [Bienertia sinuspersici]
MKNTICYKCHGQGHMARDCKTNMFISLEEHYALINKKLAEKEQSRDEILDSATNKKERRDQVLNMRRGTNLQEGDYVWLSLNAQKGKDRWVWCSERGAGGTGQEEWGAVQSSGAGVGAGGCAQQGAVEVWLISGSLRHCIAGVA